MTIAGGGTVSFGSLNSYSGGTTVSGATLQTTASGALGAGPLSLNGQPGAGATVVVGGSETVSDLSGTTTPNGPTVLYIGPGAQLNVHQDSNTTFQGTLVTSGKFSKLGAGTLEVAGASVTILGGNLTVDDSGTLRLSTAEGAMVASGVVAQVNGSATLELAGSVSNLSSAMGPPIRAAVVNNSSAAAGLLVSGPNQQVGGIDGLGDVVVTDGASLTADHIVQTALAIGGTATNQANVTISASDSNGRPLDLPNDPVGGAGSLAFAGPAWATGVFATLGGNAAVFEGAVTTGSHVGQGSPMLVPEPTGWVLAVIALFPLIGALRKIRRR